MTKTHRALLTVDWDFFVPEDVNWDLGHNETLLHILGLWQLRGHLLDVIKTSGREKDFWKWVRGWARFESKNPMVYVSESHAEAFPAAAFHRVDRVINFDAHHDCWTSTGPGLIQCHNWLSTWLLQDKSRRATWVYPPENHKLCRGTPASARRVKGQVFDPRVPLPETVVSAILICRSGAWTPPWLDRDFIRFVERFAPLYRVLTCQLGVETINPMEPRWGRREKEAARRVTRREREFLRKATGGAK
jgi:hypothetical protein